MHFLKLDETLYINEQFITTLKILSDTESGLTAEVSYIAGDHYCQSKTSLTTATKTVSFQSLPKTEGLTKVSETLFVNKHFINAISLISSSPENSHIVAAVSFISGDTSIFTNKTLTTHTEEVSFASMRDFEDFIGALNEPAVKVFDSNQPILYPVKDEKSA